MNPQVDVRLIVEFAVVPHRDLRPTSASAEIHNDGLTWNHSSSGLKIQCCSWCIASITHAPFSYSHLSVDRKYPAEPSWGGSRGTAFYAGV